MKRLALTIFAAFLIIAHAAGEAPAARLFVGATAQENQREVLEFAAEYGNFLNKYRRMQLLAREYGDTVLAAHQCTYITEYRATLRQLQAEFSNFPDMLEYFNTMLVERTGKKIYDALIDEDVATTKLALLHAWQKAGISNLDKNVVLEFVDSAMRNGVSYDGVPLSDYKTVSVTAEATKTIVLATLAFTFMGED